MNGLPAAVERSRSGNGAHVWFFFSAPVAAPAARKMGCYLITETMSRRHQLPMGSYDRLFPNQDTLPRGGFGSLIRAPAPVRPAPVGQHRKDHLELLAAGLQSVARHVLVLRGGMTPTERRAAAATLAAIPDAEPRLLIATGRYIGEGFDDARLDTLFLAMPVSWKGTLVQYAGRLQRPHPGKTEVRIYDYVDRDVPMLSRMFEKRLRGYRAIGYARGPAPLRREIGGAPLEAFDTLEAPE